MKNVFTEACTLCIAQTHTRNQSCERSFGCLIDDEGCFEIIEGIVSIVIVLLDGVDGEPGKGVVGGRLLHLANRSQSESLSFSADQTQAKLQVQVYME